MPHTPATLALRRAVAAGRRYADRWAVSPRAVDAVTATGCFALMLLDVPGLAKADNSLGRVSATFVLAAGAATLLLRRRAPWIPYLVALGFLGWLHELTLIQFALYSLGRFRGRIAGVVATLGYLLTAYVLYSTPAWPPHRGETLSEFLSLVVPIGVLASGVGIAAYRQDLIRELEAQRAETAALQAVQRERTSVARDVHDLVGRELTVLAVRAEVLSVRARAERHGVDFEELADTARRAHHTLNEIIVRRGDERTATPGLDGLPVLAAEGERIGSPVRLRITEEARRISPLRQTAVFRVVQECLTNAAKHAPGETVTVSIDVDDAARLRIDVGNRLAGSDPAGELEPVSTGTGTSSMRARVESMGGTLTAGPLEDSYHVRAVLPSGL
ncbi:sensor histidine kinase [Streptomyces sp. FIT100]|uniref:sensor histidine kinase n=1 Tax=Streptomyces sp. FIT100 TaxID=2837956 RepID=UPI0021C8780F|nr:ATP-binding protein [Streptomyces sp. FIT100]UUN26905.1 histidine kinase [Streptomyces sp. FIT100]